MTWCVLAGCAVAVLVVALLIQFIVNSRRGLSMAAHLHEFDVSYDGAMQQSFCKEHALREAFKALRNCPGICQLDDREVASALAVIEKSPNPKQIVDGLILRLSSKTLPLALRNTNFLKDMVGSQ